MVRSTLLAVLSLIVSVVIGPADAMAQDPLSAFRDQSRVLVVVAADAADHRIGEQRKLFAAMADGARERDLVLLERVGQGTEARSLRGRFGIEPSEFRAVLIGKDGGAKLTSKKPVGPDELFRLIDSMPMRQDEMRRSRP